MPLQDRDWIVRHTYGPDELKDLLGIYEQSWEHNYPGFEFDKAAKKRTLAGMNATLRGDGGILVADKHDEVIGFIWWTIFPLPTGERIAHILGIGTMEDFHRRGVGTALVLAFKREAIELGLTQVDASISITNEVAISFVKDAGMRANHIGYRLKLNANNGQSA